MLRLRAGGNYTTSPYDDEVARTKSYDLSTYGLSAGVGLKTQHFFFDFGYAYSVRGNVVKPYAIAEGIVPNTTVSSISSKYTDNRFLMTFGYNF